MPRRLSLGTSTGLLEEMQVKNHIEKNVLIMTEDNFTVILLMIENDIKKQDVRLRQAKPAKTIPAATTTFFVTSGNLCRFAVPISYSKNNTAQTNT